ncbi:MAG: hypothetical protein U5S82_15985 [Gammaproteobacteria bacterium]|nr:hypothetical protein [Gammaproteobacteria bacterium]
MASSNQYIMRDQVRNRVASIMEYPRRDPNPRQAWTTPPAAVLSFIAVVLYLTALSTAN